MPSFSVGSGGSDSGIHTCEENTSTRLAISQPEGWCLLKDKFSHLNLGEWDRVKETYVAEGPC